MSVLSAVLKARDCLQDSTPLRRDCGLYCGAACCMGDEKTGMLLFPREEALYKNCAFGRIVPTNYHLGGRIALLFVCKGECPREERPLSCRLFPARILMNGEIAMDTRAATICPLFTSGTDAFTPSFRLAVREAAKALLADTECRAFLADLDAALRL